MVLGCRDGEIGRRAWFRTMWGQPCAGSIPVPGTTLNTMNNVQLTMDNFILLSPLSFVIPAKAGIHLSPPTDYFLISYQPFLHCQLYFSTLHIAPRTSYCFYHFTLQTSHFRLAEQAQHCLCSCALRSITFEQSSLCYILHTSSNVILNLV